MKKLLALLLALVMVAAIGLASAEKLEIVPGTPSKCPIDQFKLWFDTMTQNYGYTFTWSDQAVAEDGFDVYSAVTEDNQMEVKAYTVGGNVSYVVGVSTGTFAITDESGANAFGERLGAVLGGSGLGLLIGEEGFAAVEEKAGNYEAEITPLLYVLLNGFTSEDQLAKGVAGSVTALGYPTGLELYGTTSGDTITITMTVVVASADAQLNTVD